MATTVEAIELAYKSDIAARAKADAAALDAVAAGMTKAGTAITETGARIVRALPSVDSLNKSLHGSALEASRAEAAQSKYNNSVAAYKVALDRGRITQEEYTESVRRAGIELQQAQARASAAGAALDARFTQSANRAAAASGALGNAMRQVGVQSFDVFSQLSSGAPLFTVLAQQGLQVGQSMAVAGGGMSALRAAMAAVVSPAGLAVAALASIATVSALVVARTQTIASETRDLDIALRSIGRTAEASGASLQRYIATLSQAGGLGRGEAAGIVGALARNPSLSGSAIGRVAALAPDAAVATGSDAAAAAQAVAGVAAGSYESIRKLDDALNFLTRDQLTQIRVMTEHGDKIGAAGVAMDALKGRVDGLRRDSLGPFEKSWEDLTNAIDRAIDATARAKGGLALGIVSPLASGIVNYLSPDPAKPTFRQAEDASLAAGSVERDRQAKLVEDLTRRYQDESKVLAAGIPARERVRAEIEAGNIAREKGLDVDAAAALKKAAVAAASLQAADAAAQEAAGINRAIAGSLAMVQALTDSRAAELVTAAAIEAHEAAATKAGVAESAFARAILNRNAAAEVVKASATVRDLDEQANATRRILDAQGPLARQQAELNNRIIDGTKSLAAFQEVATDPRVINQIIATRVQLEQRLKAQDALGIALREQRALEQGDLQLEDLRKQAELIGASADQRERELAAFRTLQKLRQEDAANPDSLTERQRLLIDQSREVASLQLTIRDQQNSLAAVTDTLGNAFDRLGQAMVDAFVSGAGAAVNFGNVAKAIAASVISDFAKLALVNPILNSLLPSSNGPRPTLGAALGGGGGSGLLGTAGNALTLGRIGDALGLTDFGGQLSNVGNYLGITGQGGIFNGVGSGITGILNTPLLSTNSLAVVGGAEFGPAAAVSASAPSLTIGSLLAGAGLGYGAGSLAGGYLQGALNKTGPGPQIGAGTGALAGAAIGALIGMPILGALAGGSLGGTGGGIFEQETK